MVSGQVLYWKKLSCSWPITMFEDSPRISTAGFETEFLSKCSDMNRTFSDFQNLFGARNDRNLPAWPEDLNIVILRWRSNACQGNCERLVASYICSILLSLYILFYTSQRVWEKFWFWDIDHYLHKRRSSFMSPCSAMVEKGLKPIPVMKIASLTSSPDFLKLEHQFTCISRD